MQTPPLIRKSGNGESYIVRNWRARAAASSALGFISWVLLASNLATSSKRRLVASTRLQRSHELLSRTGDNSLTSIIDKQVSIAADANVNPPNNDAGDS